MDCHIVSDNAFFLKGVQGTLIYPDGELKLVNAAMAKYAFHPHPGDIVVMYISDIRLRRNIMRHPFIRECRLMIILKPQCVNSVACKGHFPWVLPWNIRPEALSLCIRKAAAWPQHLHDVSLREWLLFLYLDRGGTVSSISGSTGLKAKYIYELKRRVQSRFGLRKCNAADILLCWDIMALNPPQENSTMMI